MKFDKSDVESAIGSFVGLDDDEDFAKEFIQQLEKSKVLNVTAKEAMTFHKHHGHTFDSHPWSNKKGKAFVPFSDPSIVIHFNGKFYVIDGQHRMNQRIKEKLTIPVVIMDGEFLKKYGVDDKHFELMKGYDVNPEVVREEKYWTEQGAGGIIQAKDTGRYLFNQRGPEGTEPGTWGTWGGKIDEGEQPHETLIREIREESGYSGGMEVKYLFTYKDKDFKFYNYLVTVPKEFEPELSWESSDYKWATLEDAPKPLHFGMKELLPYLESGLEEKKLAAKGVEFIKEPTDDGFEIIAYIDGEIAGNVIIVMEYVGSGGDCYPFQPYEEEPFYKDICDHEEVVSIQTVEVLEKHGGQGIASELMSRAMKEIKKKYAGIPVYINASPMGDVVGLDSLVKFYSSYGFKLLKKYPQWRNALLWKDKA